VYFLDVSKSDPEEPLSEAELDQLFSTINAIPLKKERDNDKDASRVVELDGNVYYLITNNDDKRIPTYKDCITGLFVKDRKFNYPYASDENCVLTEILLSNDKNSISEVTFFLIDKKLSTMLWVSNRYVSSFYKLSKYIKLLDKSSCGFDTIKLAPFERDNQNDRLDKAQTIKKYDLRLCSDIADLININQTSDAQLKDFHDVLNNRTVKYVDIKFTFNTKSDQKGIISKLIKTLSKKEGVKKANVTIKSGDSQDVIDMLCDDFLVFTTIEYGGKYISYDSIFDKLKAELDSKRKEISQHYRRR
jgi:hypothetical protein